MMEDVRDAAMSLANMLGEKDIKVRRIVIELDHPRDVWVARHMLSPHWQFDQWGSASDGFIILKLADQSERR